MKQTNSPRWVAYAPHVNSPSPTNSAEIESFNLYEVAFDIYNDFMLEARNKKIQLVLNAAQDNYSFEMEGNRIEIQFLISKMLKNALAQTLEGSIEIILSASNDEVTVEVNDTGIGIYPDSKISVVETQYRGQTCKIRYIQDPSTSLSSVGDQLYQCNAQLAIQVDEGAGMKRRLTLPKLSPETESLTPEIEFALA